MQTQTLEQAARALLEAMKLDYRAQAMEFDSEMEALRAALDAEAGRVSNRVTLTGQELLDAVEFIDNDPECEVCIGWFDACVSDDSEQEPMPAGYYVWLTEYPEEGRVLLGPDKSMLAAAQEGKQ